jgi:putative transcriptional regulator
MKERKKKTMLKYKIDVLEELKNKGYNTTVLRQNKFLGEQTIQQLRNHKMVGIKSINTICSLLDLQPKDIIEYTDIEEKKVNLMQLQVKDLKKLKIQRLCLDEEKVYFDYDGKHYLLVDDSDEENHISLYERKVDFESDEMKKEMKKNVNLIYIQGRITNLGLYSFIRDINHPDEHTFVCDFNVDKEYFVKGLVKHGFSTGLYCNEYKEMNEKIEELQNQISKISQQICDLRKDFDMTKGLK